MLVTGTSDKPRFIRMAFVKPPELNPTGNELSLREAREAAGLSLREAAKRLKISHPYLSALELGHKPLRADKEKAVRRLYSLSPKARLVDQLPNAAEPFSEWLAGQVKWWDSRFVLPMVRAVTSEISDLYVEPYFRLPGERIVRSNELLSDFFNDAENRALLLSGGMGSGKSFFLRILTVQSERMQREGGAKRRFVPILVSLGDFTLHRGSLVQSLAEYYRELGFDGSIRKLEQFLHQSIERGTALLLFDGLDEVRSAARRSEMLAVLQQHFENGLRKSGNRMIISGQEHSFASRNPSYGGFESISIEPWRSAQLFDGCKRWRWEQFEDASRFWLVLQSNDRLHRLAQWPLLFHLFATLHSAHGLRAFEDTASLFDACCQVLENSWDNARKALHGRSKGAEGEESDSLGWLKWRHFFIFAMEQSIVEADESPTSLRLRFTRGEMQEIWEKFLVSQGLDRRAFTELEDFIRQNNRIGPITLLRTAPRPDETRRDEDVYTFLDDSFAEYYVAKALINAPERLPERIARHLRSPAWENIIPLALQELCRSDRSYERNLGEQMIRETAQLDDRFELERRFRIGRVGFFTSVRSITSVNLERHWEDTICAFLDSYLFAEDDPQNGTFNTEFSRIYQILGEFSATPRVADYLRSVYERLFGTSKKSGFAHPTKWRLLGAMSKVGEQSDFAVDALVGDIEMFTKQHERLTSEERVNIRRLLWAIRACGRLFRRSDAAELVPSSSGAVARIQTTLNETFDLLCEHFDSLLSSENFSHHHYWHILGMISRDQYDLEYHDDLRRSGAKLFELVDKHIGTITSNYPDRSPLFQLLKAVSCNTRVLPPALVNSFYSKLSRALSDLPKNERTEAELILQLGKDRMPGNQGRLSERQLLERTHNKPFDILVKQWIETLRDEKGKDGGDHIALGAAVTGLELAALTSPESFQQEELEELAALLLRALNRELRLSPFQRREEERYYTRLATPYGLPLYDHFYNCLLAVSRRLPLQKT